jgi:Cupredoxin-like domain
MRWVRVATVMLLAAPGLVLTTAASAALMHRTAATRVEITFTDTSFRISPTTLEAGKTTFVVLNNGKKSHALEITGPGIKSARTPKLPAGKSATLTVTLRSGAHMLSDPVGLSAYNVQYLDVAPAEVVSASGGSSVVAPAPALPPMCGAGNNYAP